MRQLLADKVSGTMMGVWLLIPELMRLGAWDLLCGWTGKQGGQVQPRLALQMVGEHALCLQGVRQRRCLSQKGFEVANGLPFVASDQAIHEFLEATTVASTQQLQVALGRIRASLGHFPGRLLAIDPHQLHSHSKRQMVRLRPKPHKPATKVSRTFFCLDADSHQPLCCTLSSSSLPVSDATPVLLGLAASILGPTPRKPLVLADTEHHTVELVDEVLDRGQFDLMVPMPAQSYYRKQLRQLPPQAFRHRWAGIATARAPFRFQHGRRRPLWQIVQRTGERQDDFRYKGFLCTADRDEVDLLSTDYPRRWHIEEFFNLEQDLGWKKAGTPNLHIRYGQMTMALLAQAALHMLRTRLAPPFDSWTAACLASRLLRGLDGDLRVHRNRILVTYYNAPEARTMRRHYENLPRILRKEGVDSRVPWLYNFELDFRFK